MSFAVGFFTGVVCLTFALGFVRVLSRRRSSRTRDAPGQDAVGQGAAASQSVADAAAEREARRQAAEWEDAVRRVQAYSPADAYGMTDSAVPFAWNQD